MDQAAHRGSRGTEKLTGKWALGTPGLDNFSRANWPQAMSSPEARRSAVITIRQSLHLRPADLFVKLASRYRAKIELVKDDERVDGKSILALLTLAAAEGTTLVIEATGDDAEEALSALCELVEQNFADNQSQERS